MAIDNDYYKFVIHDTVEHSVVQVRQIVQQGSINDKLQKSGLALAESLLNQTLAFLAKY